MKTDACLKKWLLFYLLFIFPVIGLGQIFPIVEYSFDEGKAIDEKGNTELFLRNKAKLIEDRERGWVLHFTASEKSYAVFNKSLLNSDTCTISFFFYWEEAGARSWHQLFELYNFQTGSNLFFTPQSGWEGNKSSFISDNKEYGIYQSVQGPVFPKNQWMHLAISFYGKQVLIYTNGQKTGEGYLDITPGTVSMDSLFLGGNPYRTDNFYITARIDNFQIFDKALGPSQIMSLANEEEVLETGEFETNWATEGSPIQLIIDLKDKKQILQNFGSSDGWNTARIGKNWPLEKKEKLAELLFSTEKDAKGNPIGIGLSAWRFNIGAGTAEQGESSRISSEHRRTECFLNSDGQTYNWQKQAGQQWFLKKAAIDYNIHHIIGWQNSPPVLYTKYNLGFREYGAPMSTILKKEYFDDFARFLADVVEHFDTEGIHFDFISPLNEPQYGWAPTEKGGEVKQEGTPWTNQEIHDVVVAIDNEFSNRNIKTQLFITEAGSIHYHTTNEGHAGNQLYHFWNPNSSLSLIERPSFSNIVSYHSYWKDFGSSLITERDNFYHQLQSLNQSLEAWQTEYSLLGTGYRNGFPDGYKLTEMECALSLAKVIMADLNVANVTGWQWWTTFGLGKHSGESRFALIEALTQKDNTDGNYHLNKLFFTLGNFSHFLRPGMSRIGIKRSDNLSSIEQLSNVMFTAFTNSDESKLVLVGVNLLNTAKQVSFSIEENKQLENGTLYLTDRFTNLKKQEVNFSSGEMIIPAQSVVTYTADLVTSTSVNEKIKSNNLEAFFNSEKKGIVVRLKLEGTFNEVCLFDTNGKKIIMHKLKKGDKELFFPVGSSEVGLFIVSAAREGYVETRKVIIP